MILCDCVHLSWAVQSDFLKLRERDQSRYVYHIQNYSLLINSVEKNLYKLQVGICFSNESATNSCFFKTIQCTDLEIIKLWSVEHEIHHAHKC